MRKISKISVMFIVVLFILGLTKGVLAASKTPAKIYFEVFYKTLKTDEEKLEAFEGCTNQELENIIKLEEYYNGQSDGGQAEITGLLREWYAQHPSAGTYDPAEWQHVRQEMYTYLGQWKPTIQSMLERRATPTPAQSTRPTQPASTPTQSATPTTSGNTPARLYFELFYLTEKSNDEIIRAFERCTNQELENVIDIEEYYNGQSDGGQAEIQTAMREYDAQHPEGGNFDYSRWQEVRYMMHIPFENYRPAINTILSARQQGAQPGEQDDERARQIAEQIKQLYEEVKDDITHADVAKLNEIVDLMVELYQTDSGVRDIYESAEMTEIRVAVIRELRRRDPNTPTRIEQIAIDAAELENNLYGGLANRVGTRPPDELASYSPSDKTSPDDIIEEGSDFLTTGKDNQGNVTMNGEKVQTTSDLLFNLAFAAGIGVAAVIGTYLGIKFMLGGAEEKANIKETLLPYIMGVIIMFASFSIWKLVLVLLQAIDNI